MSSRWRETRRRLLRLTGREADEPAALAGAAPGLPPLQRPAVAFSAGEAVLRPLPRPTPARSERLAAPRAASLCVASGKGGTGKSVVCASLATAMASRGRMLILDADFGVGNAHILQDVSPAASLVDVAFGEASLRDVRVACSGQIDLLAAGSGVPRMAELSRVETLLIAAGLEELELEYRYLLVDSAAGISRQTLAFAVACDAVLVVTTPDLTAMTDAYALFKVLHAERPELVPFLLVNRAHDQAEADEVARRIIGVAQRFLSAAPVFLGWLPEDSAVPRCVNQRGAVSLLAPGCPFALALGRVAARMVEELASLHPRGMGRRLAAEVDRRASLG